VFKVARAENGSVDFAMSLRGFYAQRGALERAADNPDELHLPFSPLLI